MTPPETLPADVTQLFALQGVEAVATGALGTPWPGGAKAAWWVRLADGGEAKVRVFRTPAQVNRFLALRHAVGDHPGLSQVRGAHGRALLEEWVPGPTLDGTAVAPALLQQAAALLASLHRAPRPGDVAPGWSRATTPEALEASLIRLREAGALTKGEAATLTAMLTALRAATRTDAILHGDFCGENLVWRATRGVVSIDHEWLEIGPAEYDLGRTFQRWGLSTSDRRQFLEAYLAAGGPAQVEDLGPWELAAEIISAAVRVANARPGSDVPLHALRRRLAR